MLIAYSATKRKQAALTCRQAGDDDADPVSDAANYADPANDAVQDEHEAQAGNDSLSGDAVNNDDENSDNENKNENTPFGPSDGSRVQPWPSASLIPHPLVPATSPLPLDALPLNFDVADQVRLPFVSRIPGSGLHKTQELYGPSTVLNKWWSDAWVPERNRTSNKERDASHARRIMETDAGELYPEPCESCASSGQECWGYSKAGRDRVSKPGDRCARCRLGNQACSHSMRKKSIRGSGPVKYPSPRDIAPKGPSGPRNGSPPPPGAAGTSGILAY